MASHTHHGNPANEGSLVELSLVVEVVDDESGGGITFEPVVKSDDVGGGFPWPPVVAVDAPDACPVVVESIVDGEDPWAVEDWDEDGLVDGPGVELEGEVAGLALVAWGVVADELAGGVDEEDIPVDTLAEDTAAGAGGEPAGKKMR